MRDITVNFAARLCFNERSLTPAMTVDFGVDSDQIYTAYREALMEGDITMEGLNAAVCNGPKLTKLLRRAKHNPYRGITVTTSYDCMRPGLPNPS